MKYIKGILAGALIGIGGITYLSIDNVVVGAIFFSFGLIAVINYQLLLYTGRIGYFFEYDSKGKIETLLVFLANVIGTLIIAGLCFLAKNPNPEIRVVTVIQKKMALGYVEIFARSVLCGFMMLIAVDGYKKFNGTIQKVLIVILSVAIFIICGFEHSVANAYFLSYACFSGYAIEWVDILKLVLTFIGNSLGSICLYATIKSVSARQIMMEKENESDK